MAHRRLMVRVSRGTFTTVNSTGSQRASDRFSTENTGCILAVLPIQAYSVRLLGQFRTFFATRGKSEDSCRNRFARDARQRRVDVTRRRRGWRSIAHTVPQCVWSTDAAHLASIVCRQPPKKSSDDRSKVLQTRRENESDFFGPIKVVMGFTS
jgi:hypothetical protein